MESVHLDFLDYFPSRMIRVEQVVGLPPQRSLQELLVEGLDLRILMGEANRGLLVQLPQSVAPLPGQLLPVVDGLSAASGAAAGAGHHLHEVVAALPALQGLHQLPGIPQAGDHRHPDLPSTWNGNVF